MFGLPTTTEIRKQLPKKAIYAKADLRPAQRDCIDADVSRFDVVGFVSPDTVKALPAGATVAQFYIFTAQLKRRDFSRKSLELIFANIPQRFVLALQFEDKTMFAVNHTRIITSDWMPTAQAVIPLSGLNLDTVWDNVVTAVGNIVVAEGNSVTEQIAEDKQQANIRQQIASLRKQLSKEKQLQRKMEINQQIRELNKQLK